MTSYYQFCVTLSTVILISGLPGPSMATVHGTPPAILVSRVSLKGLSWRTISGVVDSHGPQFVGHDSTTLDAATIILKQ